MKVTVNRSLDALGADAAANLADTVRSPGFGFIQDRLGFQRHQCVEALIVATSWDDARKLQGEIAAITRSLEVPEILRRELQAAQKRTT